MLKLYFKSKHGNWYPYAGSTQDVQEHALEYHNTLIEDDVEIGLNARIDNNVVIEFNSKIGKGVELGYGAIIAAGTNIGDFAVLDPMHKGTVFEGHIRPHTVKH